MQAVMYYTVGNLAGINYSFKRPRLNRWYKLLIQASTLETMELKKHKPYFLRTPH